MPKSTTTQYRLIEGFVSEAQLDFIRRAIDVQDSVIAYDCTDAEFFETFGCTKKAMKASLQQLRIKINKL